MKHTFKTLLGLVLVVFVLAGCSNPAGPETPEVNEPPVVETPVVETPEENVRYIEVKFEWSKKPDIGKVKQSFKVCSLIYLLGLHPNSTFSSDGYEYAYDLPEEYIPEFPDLVENEEFCDTVFNSIFNTKSYKKGDKIDLQKWTSRAVRLADPNYADCLRFSTEDIDETESLDFKNVIEVGDSNMVIYVFWDSEYSKYFKYSKN